MQSLIQKIRQHRLASVVILIDLILLIALIFSSIKKSTKSSIIDVFLAPSSAKVVINGKTYENTGNYQLSPGKYTVEIKADGFDTKKIDIEAEQDNITKIYTYLTKNGSLDFYKQNLAEFELLEKVGTDQEAKKFIKNVKNAKKIENDLPFFYDEDEATFIITKGANCKKYFFCLATSSNDKELVDELIRDNGYDPEDYEIITRIQEDEK